MNKPPSPVDVFLCQMSGFLFGLLVAVTAFVLAIRAFVSWEYWAWAGVSFLLLPALGFLLGTYWGSRPRRSDDRPKGRP